LVERDRSVLNAGSGTALLESRAMGRILLIETADDTGALDDRLTMTPAYERTMRQGGFRRQRMTQEMFEVIARVTSPDEAS
jgi:hypothetical protein